MNDNNQMASKEERKEALADKHYMDMQPAWQACLAAQHAASIAYREIADPAALKLEEAIALIDKETE